MTRLFRDNPIAIAEGSSGSPIIVGLNPTVVSTPSSVSVINFTDLPALELIEFEISNLRPVTNGAVLYMLVSINNGSTYISNYAFVKAIAEVSTGGTASSATEGGYSASQISITQTSGGVNNGSSGGTSGIIQLLNAGSTALVKTALWHMNHSNGTTAGFVNVVGSAAINGVTTSQQINAVRFLFSTGNISAGKITVRPRRATATN